MKCLHYGAQWLLLMLKVGCSSTQTMEGIMSSWVDADIREVEAQGRVINWQWRGDRCPYREEGPYAN